MRRRIALSLVFAMTASGCIQTKATVVPGASREETESRPTTPAVVTMATAGTPGRTRLVVARGWICEEAKRVHTQLKLHQDAHLHFGLGAGAGEAASVAAGWRIGGWEGGLLFGGVFAVVSLGVGAVRAWMATGDEPLPPRVDASTTTRPCQMTPMGGVRVTTSMSGIVEGWTADAAGVIVIDRSAAPDLSVLVEGKPTPIWWGEVGAEDAPRPAGNR